MSHEAGPAPPGQDGRQPPGPHEAATVTLAKHPEPQGTEGPRGDRPPARPTADGGGQRRSHRPWSSRRVPAALTALAVLIPTAVCLYDVIAVRAGHRAAPWRRRLADELATRPLDDVWMLTGAGVAAALGLWLLVLALTPGRRHLLPMRAPGPEHIDAALDRDSAAALLRDAALRVPGVGHARVRVRRHRVKVRADVRFRDLRQVKDDLTRVLREQRDRLALAHPPRLVIRVRHRT
jgi:hypothetical protein